MKAMLLDTPAKIENRPLRSADIARPEPGAGQVLIRVTACGVCRSNLHMIEGEWVSGGVPAFSPIIPGHEVVGVVAETGSGVVGFEAGDRVGVQPIWSTCGRCAHCLEGREHLCQQKKITGETVNGGYAEYILANEAYTYRLPESVNDAEAAPLFCPGITAYGSALKAHLSPGQTVAVFGIGGVGHVVVQMARLFGAEVVAVARSRAHLGLAEEMGAARLVDALNTDPGEELVKAGQVDASIVFAPSNQSVAQAIQGTKPGGRIVLGVNAEVGVLPFATEKTIVGSILGSRAQMLEVLQLAAAGKIRTVTESFPLEQANEILARLKRGEIRARAVLVN